MKLSHEGVVNGGMSLWLVVSHWGRIQRPDRWCDDPTYEPSFRRSTSFAGRPFVHVELATCRPYRSYRRPDVGAPLPELAAWEVAGDTLAACAGVVAGETFAASCTGTVAAETCAASWAGVALAVESQQLVRDWVDWVARRNHVQGASKSSKVCPNSRLRYYWAVSRQAASRSLTPSRLVQLVAALVRPLAPQTPPRLSRQFPQTPARLSRQFPQISRQFPRKKAKVRSYRHNTAKRGST